MLTDKEILETVAKELKSIRSWSTTDEKLKGYFTETGMGYSAIHIVREGAGHLDRMNARDRDQFLREYFGIALCKLFLDERGIRLLEIEDEQDMIDYLNKNDTDYKRFKIIKGIDNEER